MGQTRLLARTFFSRLFESDLMPDGLPQVQLLLWGALLAAAPTSLMSLTVTEKYQRMIFAGPLDVEFAADRMVLIVLSMMAFGFVGLVIWDGVFPDRRDVRILGPLPVPMRRFVAARLIAVAQVFGVVAMPVCLPQSVFFPLAVAGFGDPVPRAIGILAHLATVTAAGIFVFAALIGIQCLLLTAFGRNAAQHVSVAFQLLFAVGIFQLLVFLPDLGNALRHGGRAHEGLTGVAALPPTWFFGMYEWLAGTADGLATRLAAIATAALGTSLVLGVGLYAVAYGPLCKRALEGPAPRARRLLPVSWIRAAARRLPLPAFNAPLRSAVRRFALQTTGRSRSHRMMLAIYGGVALAIIFSSAVGVVVRDGWSGLRRPNLPMLTMPFVFQFLMLIGVRVVLAIPSEPRARWVFRLLEPAQRAAATAGARDQLLLLVVIPSALFALAQGLFFWTAGAALRHAVFTFVLGRLFAELLILRLDKLPFACTYYPGKSRVFTLWPLYLMAFFLYTLLFAQLDGVFIAWTTGLVRFSATVLALVAFTAFMRRRFLAAVPGLRFEEEDPDLMFQGFNLSEGLAAAPRQGLDIPVAQRR